MTHQKIPLVICEHQAQLIALALELYVGVTMRSLTDPQDDTPEGREVDVISIRAAKLLRDHLGELCPTLPEPEYKEFGG